MCLKLLQKRTKNKSKPSTKRAQTATSAQAVQKGSQKCKKKKIFIQIKKKRTTSYIPIACIRW